ncbi:MAG: hypothetical protein ACFE8N_10690, partial [Promethearchaeota archaeon]
PDENIQKHGPAPSFSIGMEEESSFSIPSNFLSDEYKSQMGFLTKEIPDFDVKISKNNNKIVVELLSYIIPFTNVISKDIIEKITSFSDWIDYWAINFDSGNEPFMYNWYSYRTPKNRTLSTKSDAHFYDLLGTYKILIKIIDIFGIETQKTYEVDLSFD